ncbi:Paraquat-inducible protein B [Olavius sp. associated proteobacterium Delta 1]|nr:Paraquat-inducible protein B [Olavius sp. associated proteobacterium Delta 1]
MSEENARKEEVHELPDAVVSTRRHQISIVWFVPLVALLIGGWLVYKTLSEKGPIITIAFKSAEGLEAGKTKIKYKDVELGQVTEIRLTPDLSRVLVTAELVKEAKEFLSANTRFWVVRARVAAGQISGLGTLFSGAYIGLDPGKPGLPGSQFVGMEIPPVVTTDLPGRHYRLHASRLGSLDIGAPVYFRQIKVGQVVGYKLEEDGEAVSVKIFINDPVDKQVHKNTRFWNASGLDFAVDAGGIRVNTESLVTILIGGIAFDTPANLEPGGPAEDGDNFKLYESRERIFDKTYTEKSRWLLYFEGSVRGLTVGSPVEFRGIPVGQVLDINMEYDAAKKVFLIPVLIEIEQERIKVIGEMNETDRKEQNDYLVAQGMRAQLKTGSLITGQLYVDLDFHPNAEPAQIVWEGRYPQMPTVPTSMEEITTSLTHLLKKLEKLPIEQIGNDLRDTVQGAKRLVNSAELQEAIAALNQTLTQVQQFTATLSKVITPALRSTVANLNTTLQHTQKLAQNFDRTVVPELNTTLKEAQSTLNTIKGSVSKDSPLYYELMRVFKELSGAARSIRVMADYLERNPDALIYGKGKRR